MAAVLWQGEVVLRGEFYQAVTTRMAITAGQIKTAEWMD